MNRPAPFIALLEAIQAMPEGHAWIPAPAESCEVLVQTGNHKELYWVFAKGDRQPCALIKRPRHPEDGIRIEREASRLAALGRPPLAGRPGIPATHLALTLDSEPLLVLPFFPGQPMSHLLAHPFQRFSERRWMRLLDRAAQWLLDLQKAGRLRLRDGQPSMDENKMLAGQPALREALYSGELEATVQHGDFNPANILVDGETLTVVDWEWSEWPGLPLVDLINLALRSSLWRTTWGHSRGRLPCLEDFHNVLIHDTPERRFLARWAPRFQSELSIHPRFMPYLFNAMADLTLSTTEERSAARQLDTRAIFSL